MPPEPELPAGPLTDRGDSDRELRRVFQICQECRRCRDLCPAFPSLFTLVEAHGGVASALSGAEADRVVDLCYQCNRCFENCPYVPPHPWQVDLPRLLLGANLARKRERGLSARDRLLGHPDLTGAILAVCAPIWNRAKDWRSVRLLLEATFGIHRDGDLPRAHGTSFERWFRKREKRFRRRVRGGNGKVALFHTCSVNVYHPEVGRSAVAVLHHNDVEVVVPPQRCCGAAHLAAGDLEGALQNVEENARSFAHLADAGYSIVVLQPACSHWLRLESPRRSPSPEARRNAPQTQDLAAYLLALHRRGTLSTEFRSLEETLALHLPCRRRGRQVGQDWADLLGLVPGLELRLIEECAAMEGAWGLKKEFHAEWGRQVAPLLRAIDEAGAAHIASDCLLAGLGIRRGTGRPCLHPIEILREAYGIGLPT
jgi:glycerol-3-phosphate dehydrogenase subunit C